MKERLELNKQKMTGISQRLNELEQEKQNLIQELLRLDGENRLILELESKK